jgi:hypothetical protein
MSASAAVSTPAVERTAAAATRVPWYLWCSALAVASAYIGGYWDISWHRSIGRDSFWTPPHLAIYACGLLAGIASAYLIGTTTRRPDAALRAVSVRIWGFHAPLGAFLSAWGGLAMLVSAPFDNWWHNAYGLDVRIISPPHMVLAAGFFGIEAGTVLMIAAFMNRADGVLRRSLQRVFLFVGACAVCESLLLKLEYIGRPDMHNALFYRVVVLGTLMMLVSLAVVSRHRWACTIMAAIYTAFGVGFLWLLPLLPAEPKLGPVFRPVTHFIPWEFPLLIVVPALAADLILQRTTAWRPLLRALAIGAAFLTVFVLVQWPFADFLMQPLARNRVFGAGYFDFATRPSSAYARYAFFPREASRAEFWRGMAVALATSCVMAWIGLHLGRLMQRVRR